MGHLRGHAALALPSSTSCAPQDGLYAVLERGAASSTARVVEHRSSRGALRGRAAEPGCAGRLADPAVRGRDPDGHREGLPARPGRAARPQRPASCAADVGRSAPRQRGRPAGPRPAAPPRRRRRAPITVLSLRQPRPTTARVVRRLVVRLLPRPCRRGRATPLASGSTQHVSFPSSMVDRIVPATTDDDRADGRAICGRATTRAWSSRSRSGSG